MAENRPTRRERKRPSSPDSISPDSPGLDTRPGAPREAGEEAVIMRPLRNRKRSALGRIGPWLLLIALLTAILIMYRSAYQSPGPESEAPPRRSVETSRYKKASKRAKARLRVIVSELNFRSSPKIAAANLIGQIPRGTILLVLSKKAGWYRVMTPEGEVGYVTTESAYTEPMEADGR